MTFVADEVIIMIVQQKMKVGEDMFSRFDQGKALPET